MNWSEHSDPVAFAGEVMPFLMKDEAMNCLFIGVLDTLVKNPGRYKNFRLLALQDGDSVAGAAWLTPPYALGMSELPRPEIQSLVDIVEGWDPAPGGVIGPAETAKRFMDRFGRTPSTLMRQCIHRIDVAPPAPKVAGQMRVAVASDLDLLEKWNVGFCVDCKLAGDAPDARREAEAVVKLGTRFLWEVDGRPVSMAGCQGDTPSGIRVAWVYTPPGERGKGYGSAVVGALTRQLLEKKKCCFLFTDLDNPVSNRLYHNLGYRPVGDFLHCTF